jgi:hypothetical protein
MNDPNSYCLDLQRTSKSQGTRIKRKGLRPIAESDALSLGHDQCGSGGFIYNKDTSQNTFSDSLLAFTMIDPSSSGWLEIVKATNKSATSIQDLFHSNLVDTLPVTSFYCL